MSLTVKLMIQMMGISVMFVILNCMLRICSDSDMDVDVSFSDPALVNSNSAPSDCTVQTVLIYVLTIHCRYDYFLRYC